jgi:biotin carboxylase
MATVLVIYPGTGSHRRALVRRHERWLRERGIGLVLADDEPAAEDGEVFDDVLRIAWPEQVLDAVKTMEEYAREHQIDAILAQSETGLPVGAVLAERLGISGVPMGAAFRCVNKYASRMALSAAGVPVPHFVLASGSGEVRRFAEEEAGWPVVLKGVASTMGRLVTKVDGPEEVEAAVHRMLAGLSRSEDVKRLLSFTGAAGLDPGCDPRRQFLVEAFASGDPVETDGIVIGGEPQCFGVTEQVMTPPPRFFIEAYRFPAERPVSELTEIERISADAIRATELDRSGFSIELRAGEQGIRIIEVNGRLGQDDGFGDLFREATGAEPHVLALEVALGLRPTFHRPDHRWALAYRSWYEDGIVRRLPPPEALSALEAQGVLAGLAVRQDESLHAPPHPLCYPHLAWVLASHPGSSTEALRRARSLAEGLPFRIEQVR